VISDTLILFCNESHVNRSIGFLTLKEAEVFVLLHNIDREPLLLGDPWGVFGAASIRLHDWDRNDGQAAKPLSRVSADSDDRAVTGHSSSRPTAATNLAVTEQFHDDARVNVARRTGAAQGNREPTGRDFDAFERRCYHGCYQTGFEGLELMVN
jgi:hypothetical protein